MPKKQQSGEAGVKPEHGFVGKNDGVRRDRTRKKTHQDTGEMSEHYDSQEVRLDADVLATWDTVEYKINNLSQSNLDHFLATGAQWGWFSASDMESDLGNKLALIDEIKTKDNITKDEARKFRNLVKELGEHLEEMDKIYGWLSEPAIAEAPVTVEEKPESPKEFSADDQKMWEEILVEVEDGWANPAQDVEGVEVDKAAYDTTQSIPEKATKEDLASKDKRIRDKEKLGYFFDSKTGLLKIGSKVEVNLSVPGTELIYTPVRLSEDKKTPRGFEIAWKKTTDSTVIQALDIAMDEFGRLSMKMKGQAVEGGRSGFRTKSTRDASAADIDEDLDQLKASLDFLVFKIRRMFALAGVEQAFYTHEESQAVAAEIPLVQSTEEILNEDNDPPRAKLRETKIHQLVESAKKTTNEKKRHKLLSEAMNKITKRLTVLPNATHWWVYMAYVGHLLGDTQTVKEALNKVVEKDPNNEVAKKILDKMEKGETNVEPAGAEAMKVTAEADNASVVATEKDTPKKVDAPAKKEKLPKPVAVKTAVEPATEPAVEQKEDSLELTRERLVDAVEKGVDILKTAIRKAAGEKKNRLDWVVDAVNRALAVAKGAEDGKIEVSAGGQTQREGVPVDDLIEELQILAINTKKKKEQDEINHIVKLLSDNSLRYFEDAHPEVMDEVGKPWNRQHWRTQLEAYYISGDKDYRRTGNMEEDYKKAMEAMSKRRELNLDQFNKPKKTTKPDNFQPVAVIKGHTAPISSVEPNGASVATEPQDMSVPDNQNISVSSAEAQHNAGVDKKKNQKQEETVSSDWSSSYFRKENEIVPTTGVMSKMTTAELARWREYNEWAVCLAAASEGGLAQLADPKLEDRVEFNDMIRGLVDVFAVHGRVQEKSGQVKKMDYADLDGRTCIKLLSMAGFKTNLQEGENKETGNVDFSVPGKAVKNAFNTDTGGRDGFSFNVSLAKDANPRWQNIAYNKIRGVTTVLDHHAWFSNPDSSAASFVYGWLTEHGYLKRTKELDRIMDFVTTIDSMSNFGYGYNRRGDTKLRTEIKHVFERSYRTLVGMARYVPFEKYDELFRLVSRKDFDIHKELTNDEMVMLGIVEHEDILRAVDGGFASGESRTNPYYKEKTNVENTAAVFEEMKKNGLVISVDPPDKKGPPVKVAINLRGQGFPQLPTGFNGAVACGADIFVDWNEKQQSFFVSSAFKLPKDIRNVEGLTDKDGVYFVRQTMLIKPLTLDRQDRKDRKIIPFKISLGNLLDNVVGTNWEPNGVLKDYLDNHKV